MTCYCSIMCYTHVVAVETKYIKIYSSETDCNKPNDMYKGSSGRYTVHFLCDSFTKLNRKHTFSQAAMPLMAVLPSGQIHFLPR